MKYADGKFECKNYFLINPGVGTLTHKNLAGCKINLTGIIY